MTFCEKRHFFVAVILLCIKMLAIGNKEASEDFFEIFRKSSILYI